MFNKLYRNIYNTYLMITLHKNSKTLLNIQKYSGFIYKGQFAAIQIPHLHRYDAGAVFVDILIYIRILNNWYSSCSNRRFLIQIICSYIHRIHSYRLMYNLIISARCKFENYKVNCEEHCNYYAEEGSVLHEAVYAKQSQ